MKKSAICPLMKGQCIERRCLWYIQLRGTNKNTGQEIDDWGCAVSWLPVLLIENAAMARQTGAAVESLRNESIKSEDATRKVLLTGMGLFEPAMRQIESDGDGRP